MSKVDEEAGPPVSEGTGGENWIPVVPLSALPRGEQRVIVQDGETVASVVQRPGLCN